MQLYLSKIREYFCKWPLGYLAPILLVTVAALQNYEARTQHLSPWKGGGFGMFSTGDLPSQRVLHCYLISANEPPLLVAPSTIGLPKEEFDGVVTNPSPKKLREIARDIASRSWQVFDADDIRGAWQGIPEALRPHLQPRRSFQNFLDQEHDRLDHPTGVPRIALPSRVAESEYSFVGVRVEVWRTTFDAPTSQMRAKKLLGVTVERGGEEDL